jgi:class 3 adenylate cyclase
VSIPYTYNAIAKEYKKEGKYDSALYFHQKAYTTSDKVHKKLYMVQSLIGLANISTIKGDAATALYHYKKAEELSKEINAIDELKDIYMGLAAVHASIKNYRDAYKYQMLLTNVKDTIYNIATDKKLAGLQFDFDLQKKQSEINLLTKDRQLQELRLNREKMAKNILIGGLAIAFIIAIILYRNYLNKIKVNKLLDRQNAEIENLILNILPEEVAHELQKNGNATPRYYESASVLFTDFKSFSKHADALSPQEVVTELNECFVAFDEIIIKYNLEKIKTIGDSYMCAGGIPTEDDNHYINIIKASLEIRDYMEERNRMREEAGLPAWDIRIGVNTGPIVAGVVGRKKYAYDIWGGTVNVASRMESNGEPGKVNISAATYEFIKHRYACTHRGKIMAKNVGEVDMYFVENEIDQDTQAIHDHNPVQSPMAVDN